MSKIGKDALIEKPVEKQKQKTAEQQKPANFKIEFAKVFTSRLYSAKQSLKFNPHQEFSDFNDTIKLPKTAKI